jgi:L-amino acid N-acyltransferase YncA
MNAHTLTNATIRRAAPADAPAIAAIYGPYVRDTTITFETVPPTTDQMEQRIRTVTASYPWLVASVDGVVVGYAYASRYRERQAYCHTAEVSVYVDKTHTGRGIGGALLGELLAILREREIAVLIAGIALPNAPSVKLHEKFSFACAGVLKSVGYKLGAWIDVGYWQLALRDTRDYRPEK